MRSQLVHYLDCKVGSTCFTCRKLSKRHPETEVVLTKLWRTVLLQSVQSWEASGTHNLMDIPSKNAPLQYEHKFFFFNCHDNVSSRRKFFSIVMIVMSSYSLQINTENYQASETTYHSPLVELFGSDIAMNLHVSFCRSQILSEGEDLRAQTKLAVSEACTILLNVDTAFIYYATRNT